MATGMVGTNLLILVNTKIPNPRTNQITCKYLFFIISTLLFELGEYLLTGYQLDGIPVIPQSCYSVGLFVELMGKEKTGRYLLARLFLYRFLQ